MWRTGTPKENSSPLISWARTWQIPRESSRHSAGWWTGVRNSIHSSADTLRFSKHTCLSSPIKEWDKGVRRWSQVECVEQCWRWCLPCNVARVSMWFGSTYEALCTVRSQKTRPWEVIELCACEGTGVSHVHATWCCWLWSHGCRVFQRL